MMIVLAGWAFLVLPAILRSRLAILHPARASRLARSSISAGALLVVAGLIATVAPTLLEGIGAHHLALLCRRLLHDLLSGGHVGGIIAAFAATWVIARGIRTWLDLERGRRVARIEPWIGDHFEIDGHHLAVVPAIEPVAVANKRQVVLSSGLLELLGDREIELVTKHEIAHLRWRHHRYFTWAAIVESTVGALPFVASSVAALRFFVERWADEEAAGHDKSARRTLSAAITAVADRRPAPGLAGLAGSDQVDERVRALTDGPTEHAPRLRMLTSSLACTVSLLWLGSVGVVTMSLVSGVGCS